MRVVPQFCSWAARRGPTAAAAAVGSLCLALAAACSSGSVDVKATVAAGAWHSPSPFAYGKIYNYPDPSLYDAVATLQENQQGAEAAKLAALGAIPSSFWAAGQSGEMPGGQERIGGRGEVRRDSGDRRLQPARPRQLREVLG